MVLVCCVKSGDSLDLKNISGIMSHLLSQNCRYSFGFDIYIRVVLLVRGGKTAWAHS